MAERTRKTPTPKKPVKRRRGYSRSKVIDQELVISRRKASAAKLKLAGWSYREIAGHLKCSIGTVHSDLASLIDEETQSAQDTIRRERALTLQRLDRATKRIWAAVETGELDAVDRLVKLENRRAKLLGLDAPTRQELSGPDGAPIPIDARSEILDRLARLAAGAPAAGDQSEVPREPEPS